MNDLMTGILGRYQGDVGQTIDLEIYGGDTPSKATLMFDSDLGTVHAWETNANAVFQIDRALDIAGHTYDILDFSKIEAGKLDLETLDFDLLNLLDDFAGGLALHAHDQGLEFICATDPEIPTRLRGDPGRLRQILTNL